MPAWGWMVVGVALLVTELFLIDAQLYLVFLGVAAALVGLAEWAGLVPSPAMQWLLFAALSLLALGVFRRRVYQKLRPPAEGMPDATHIGDRVELPHAVQPGQFCRVEYRGTSWNARNIDAEALSGEAEIAQVDELTLLLKRSGH